ncbi:MAG TPA: GreA/GreB family elongation factor [Chthoniobacter sp.]|jgi:transcription elongation GreA/GreB family factor
MSRAFTKEDHEIPERAGRKRSRSGLPPGAANYMTAKGADHFRRELEGMRAQTARKDPAIAERISELEELLQDVTVVPARTETPAEVLFGTTVTTRSPDGTLKRLRIVGVDETALDPDSESWCSPTAKVLLGAEIGQRIQLSDGTKVEIVEISP